MVGPIMSHGSRTPHEAMIARLARSTLRDRFSVGLNPETLADHGSRVIQDLRRRRPAKWASSCDITADNCASKASLRALPHGFHPISFAFCRASFTYVRANGANAMSERRATREQGYAGSANFKTLAAKPDTFPHRGRIRAQAFVAALDTPS